MGYEERVKHVSGTKKGDILMFALSTCVWCKKTKTFLKELGVDYDYVDVDLLGEDEREEAQREMQRWNPSVSFPTVVIDNKDCIVGYRPEELKEKLGL
ncbi:MAG: glutaredoxin family protein [candidate division Zixibacteria bacterium]|nr:glutaredoxin family protein [candidate division Zixibacteria bacterium]